MKSLILLFFLPVVVTLQYCTSEESVNDVVPDITGSDSLTQIIAGDDSLIPDSIKAELREDASRLALRDIYSDSTLMENLIILPAETVNAYYNGFVHVYNADSISARDSVFAIYNIRTWYYPILHELIVAVDSTAEWLNNWQNGQPITGNQQVDTLMEAYNIQIERYYQWPMYHAVVLNSTEAINVYALCKRFELVEDVIHAYPNGYAGDGDDITGNIKTNYLIYEFSRGWGDCMAGCIYRHYWLFHINFNGGVEFIKSYGDPIP